MINTAVEDRERVARDWCGSRSLTGSFVPTSCVTAATGWTLRPSPSLQRASACLTG